MKKSLLAAAAICALTIGAASAQTAEGPWMVRARAVSLQSTNGDGTSLGLSINNKVIPEVDFTYFFTPNVAAELILTVPQQHTLHSRTVGGDIGTLKHLPPTLLLQYHFDAPGYKPYVGAGMNFTRFSDVDLTVAGAEVQSTSVGGALQVGVDVPVGKRLYVNFDIKKVYIGTDVYLNGSKLGTFRVDPLLIGVGLGYRF